MVMKMKPDADETIPALVARVQLKTQEPRVNGGPPRLNNITQADVDKLNQDKTIENKVMNAPDGWGATPSERNRAGQHAPSFAGLNSDLTFSRIAASPFADSNYMRSRKVG
jgi:hypothetical protein